MCLPYLRELRGANSFEHNHGTHHSEEPSGFNVKEPKVSIGTSSSSTFSPVGASLVADMGPSLLFSGVCCFLNTATVSSSAFIQALSRSISSCSSFVSLSMNLHRGPVRNNTKRAVCQCDLPSAFPGLELTLWAYTLTPTANTSVTWSAEGKPKAGLDFKIGLTPSYCTARPN